MTFSWIKNCKWDFIFSLNGVWFLLLMLATFLASTLKMEATCFSESSVDFRRTTRGHIPEDITLHNHCFDSLKSNSSSMNCTPVDINVTRIWWRGLDTMKKRRNAYKIFAWKTKEKRQLRKPNCRRAENIKMALKESGSSVLIGFACLTIVAGFCETIMKLGFHKMLGMSSVAVKRIVLE
jgi:hypothetical protein